MKLSVSGRRDVLIPETQSEIFQATGHLKEMLDKISFGHFSASSVSSVSLFCFSIFLQLIEDKRVQRRNSLTAAVPEAQFSINFESNFFHSKGFF